MAPRKTSKSKSAAQASASGDSRPPKKVVSLKPIDRESLLNHIQATLPLPMRDEECADGSVVFVGGDPGEVVVRVARTRVTVSVFGITLDGLQTPLISPQSLISLNWKRLPAAQLTVVLRGMINTARRLRRSQYRKCHLCGETKPPEWMHAAGGCHSCAQHTA